MGKRLSIDEWAKVKAPFYYVRMTNIQDTLILQMIVKFLEANAKGWFYDYSSTIVFELDTDQVMFSFWMKSKPFENDHGVIAEQPSP